MKEGTIATRAKMCCHRSIISIFGQLSKADALQLFFSTISPRSQGNIEEIFFGSDKNDLEKFVTISILPARGAGTAVGQAPSLWSLPWAISVLSQDTWWLQASPERPPWWPASNCEAAICKSIKSATTKNEHAQKCHIWQGASLRNSYICKDTESTIKSTEKHLKMKITLLCLSEHVTANVIYCPAFCLSWISREIWRPDI